MSNPLHENPSESQQSTPVDRHPPNNLQRYRSLVSHLICESLGYFTPQTALRAVDAHRQKKPFACEWYSHMVCCSGKGMFDHEALIQINRETIRRCFDRRHHHCGYMAEYQNAKALVDREITQEGSTQGMLASWF